MKRTKIVGTIGPSSEKEEVLAELLRAGLDLARLNCSHGCYEEHAARIARIRALAAAQGREVGIILDIQGPKIRTGEVAEGVTLAKGQEFWLTPEEVPGDATQVTIRYPDLLAALSPGFRVYIDDGLLALQVEEIKGGRARTRVLVGGPLKAHKGVTLPGVRVNLPAVTEKDKRDLAFGVANGVDYIAASFVRRAEHIAEVRALVEAAGGKADIIAKVENKEGVENIDEIIAAADGIMVARGDMGVELPPEEVPLIQKMIIEKSNEAGKPVIIATQMLDSMVRNPRPTRAEVNDVATAVFQGTDAVMLSGETAVGQYPVEAVKVMARIVTHIEESLNYEELLQRKRHHLGQSVADAVCHATCQSALDLGVAAIISSTQSGSTARMVAKYRPKPPILAATPNREVARKLTLVWGVYPVVVPRAQNIDEMIDVAVAAALRVGCVKPGDLTALTAGVRTDLPGSTNLLKIHRIGEENYHPR